MYAPSGARRGTGSPSRICIDEAVAALLAGADPAGAADLVERRVDHWLWERYEAPAVRFRWPLLGAFVGGIWAERARPLGLPGIVTDAPGGIGLSYIMVIAAVLAGGFLFVVAAGLFEHLRLALRHQHGQRPAKAPGPREGVAHHQYRRAYPGSLYQIQLAVPHCRCRHRSS